MPKKRIRNIFGSLYAGLPTDAGGARMASVFWELNLLGKGVENGANSENSVSVAG